MSTNKTTTFVFTCDCRTEIRSPTRLVSVLCSRCHVRHNNLKHHAWDLEESPDEDVEFDPVKDGGKPAFELWGAQVSRFFNINMRLDSANPGNSTVGSIDPGSRPTVSAFKIESDPNANVAEVKGGRKDAKGMMWGDSAHDHSKRGVQGAHHQGEEWLHLWGDNLGGPSAVGNFVAGSYDANTEMLVIEQALAINIRKTKGIGLRITALCSKEYVGEFIEYRVIDPSNSGNDFIHHIDLTNRYFTKVDKGHVQALIDPWLKQHNLFDDAL